MRMLTVWEWRGSLRKGEGLEERDWMGKGGRVSYCVRVKARKRRVGQNVGRRGGTMDVRVNENMITTAFELPGYRVARSMGLVRGITVRSRSILGTIGASLETLVGGNITLFEEMCETTREQALELMMQHAVARGANAVIGVRYDSNELMQGVTEVLVYGTAVVVEKAG
jgi:uncharacterized protein YbjQ (UPF0145 family)